MTFRVPVFDLDGTLLDSDQALLNPFIQLGVAEDAVKFGLPLEQACSELGVSLEDYLTTYDVTAAQPFDGIEELLASLDRWAIFSNKHETYAEPELLRLGWKPDVVLCSGAFDGPKTLQPVLDKLSVSAADVMCVGDSEHDRACATEVRVPFALAGWNPRTTANTSDIVLRKPLELLDYLG